MKKILGLTIVAILVMALVGGGTWAYFSDTETSTGNTISAGTLDLKINSTDANYVILTTNITNAKPGDSALELAPLTFAGTISQYYLTANLTKSEAAGTDTDAETDAGGAGVGNLGDLVEFTFFIDLDSNGWDEGDYYLNENNSLVAVAAGPSPASPSAAASILDNFDAVTWSGISVESDPDDAARFYIWWEFPNGDESDNKAQGDTATIGFGFKLIQGTP